jgi:hypothetical protein
VKRIILIALLIGCAAAAPQQAEKESLVSIVDRSSSGSPLVIRGNVTARDNPTNPLRYSIEGKISLTNVSSKPVFLTVVSLQGTNVPGINDRWSDDYYFSEPFEPQAIEDREWTFGPFVSRMEVKSDEGSKWVDIQPERSTQQKIAAWVLFVQYADGSTWGDPEKAKDALEERNQSIRKLRTLELVYRRQGEKALVDELLKPTFLPAILSLQNQCKNTDDKSIVVDQLLRMRAASDEHARMLKVTQGR